MGGKHTSENENKVEDLTKRIMLLESHIVECDAVIAKLIEHRKEIVTIMEASLSDIDHYTKIIQKQRSRFSGDVYALERAVSVINDEKRKKEWRENIQLRDGFCCRRCGSKEDITLHHIIPKSICSPELIWDETNGIVLCQKCHNEWHAKNGTDASFVKFIAWLKGGPNS